MKLQKNNDNACVATAFAMCINAQVDELLDHLPDSNEILFNHEEHKNERGHHPQELIDRAFARGFLIMEIEADPRIGFHQGDMLRVFPEQDTREARIKIYMTMAPCVVIGFTAVNNRHAVAYDPETNKYYDPRGHILDTCPVSIDTVFLIFDRRIKEA